VLNLWCRIAAEIANAGGCFINLLDELLDGTSFPPVLRPPKMPVLTEETVKGARTVKNCEVLVASLWPTAMRILRVAGIAPSRTNPVCDAVRRKRVVIPLDECMLGIARVLHELSTDILPDAAIAESPFRDGAGVNAHRAPRSIYSSWRTTGQTKMLMILRVRGQGRSQYFPATTSKAIHANAD
jgi:hypothetical protein